jgi:hypothetical protein
MFVLSRRMIRLYASLLGAAVSSAALADPGGLPAEIQALRVKVETIQSQQTSAQAQLASLLSAVNSLTAAGNSLQTALRRWPVRMWRYKRRSPACSRQ